MMGNGGNFDFGNMMNGGWNGGWPVFLLGALVVAGIVLVAIWAVRAGKK